MGCLQSKKCEPVDHYTYIKENRGNYGNDGNDGGVGPSKKHRGHIKTSRPEGGGGGFTGGGNYY